MLATLFPQKSIVYKMTFDLSLKLFNHVLKKKKLKTFLHLTLSAFSNHPQLFSQRYKDSVKERKGKTIIKNEVLIFGDRG